MQILLQNFFNSIIYLDYLDKYMDKIYIAISLKGKSRYRKINFYATSAYSKYFKGVKIE